MPKSPQLALRPTPFTDACEQVLSLEQTSPDTREAEHYIPLRAADLATLLRGELPRPSTDIDNFDRLCELLAATFQFEFHKQLEELKNHYAPFNPDRDTVTPASLAVADDSETMPRLFDKFAWLLERANFVKLPPEDLRNALNSSSDWGLNLEVDFEIFERLEIYVRGDGLGTRSRRRLRNRFRLEEIPVPIYQRLVVIFRLRNNTKLGDRINSQDVFIKLFKEIPKADLEMLLPGTRVKMSLLDRAKILMPTISGLAITTFKIVKGALLVAAVGVSSILMLLGLLGGTVGYGVRSFFGYLRTKEKYQLSLTRSLYFQNLDNNAGVLFRVLDEAEEQENREAMLAYFFLWQYAPQEGWLPAVLDHEIERYLSQQLDKAIDFEVGDALDKLIRLGIVETTSQGKLRALPIHQALVVMDHAWDNFFRYSSAA